MVSMLLRVWKCKTLLVMRLTLLICLFFAFQSIAIEALSQNKRLSINQKIMKIEEIIQLIENKTDYYFMYSAKTIDVQRTVDIEAKDKLVPEILDDIFNGTNISYKVDGRLIALSKKGEESVLGQQQKTVSGKVTDSSGAPLPGVSVVVKGTTTGVITDMEGKYSLLKVPENATLQFSFVGMKTQEIRVVGNTTINVTLEEETIGLDEVVAIGYGTVKKADLTGSIASVQGNSIAERKTTKVAEALQGAIAGVTVTRSGDAPGANATIRVRGITTIGTSTPLVIIDGVQGDINSVDPNDIDNISVLKDAASASIYGSKAAAGVILITTKRAKIGQANLEYNFEYGLYSPTRIPKYVGAVQFMKMANELVWNDANNLGTEYPTYAQNLIENYGSLHAENPDMYPDTDYADYINDFAPRQSHLLSFTAGEKNLRTHVSLSYEKKDALTNYRSFQRFNARVNNDLRINEMLTAHFDLYYINTTDRREIVNLAPTMLRLEPTMVPFYGDGRVATVRNGESPWAQLEKGGTDDGSDGSITGKVALDFTPLKGLKISGIVAPNYYTYKEKIFSLKNPMTSLDNPNLITGYVGGQNSTSLNERRNDSHSITTQFLADYTKSYGDHKFNLLVGYESYYSINENLSASRSQYTLNNYPYLDLGPLDYRNNSGDASEYSSRSYFGRIMYNYNDKYLFQSNVRYDGSSRFAKKYRYGLFPSFSAGWVISEESFMKDITFLSSLKLRASWGSLGNERIGNYPYQSTVSFGNSLLRQGGSVISSQTAYIGSYAIEDISWETTESLDVGLDVNLFKNKLQVTADYFKKTTRDMLLALEIPDYIGLGNPDQNTGKMSTKGWEFEISYNNKIGNLHYSVSANVFDSKSIMGDLGGTEFIGNQVKKKGSEFNEWYGYKAIGLFQTQDEVNNSAVTNSRVKPGDIKYQDISGPDGVPDGIISSTYDRVLLGGSLPKYQYGGTINLEYKNFDFSIIFQGIGKVKSYKSTDMIQPLWGGGYGVPSFIPENYWSKYNTDEQNAKVYYPRLSEVSANSQSPASGNNYVMSDYWLFNGGYFRLKNVILGYSLPKQTIEKIGMSNVRFYVNLSDFFAIDKYPKGWDPESISNGYFITKAYIFGISVKF